MIETIDIIAGCVLFCIGAIAVGAGAYVFINLHKWDFDMGVWLVRVMSVVFATAGVWVFSIGIRLLTLGLAANSCLPPN